MRVVAGTIQHLQGVSTSCAVVQVGVETKGADTNRHFRFQCGLVCCSGKGLKGRGELPAAHLVALIPVKCQVVQRWGECRRAEPCDQPAASARTGQLHACVMADGMHATIECAAIAVRIESAK